MKKTAILSLAIIMCFFAVTGSIAYFTDSIDVQNVVKAGNLKIAQSEYMRDNGDLVAWKEQSLYPAVKKEGATSEFLSVDGKLYTINEESMNGFVDKIVVVENQGSLQTYVRTFVALPASFDEAIQLEWNESADGWFVENKKPEDNKPEPILADITCTIDGQEISGQYAIYYATYQQKLAAKDDPQKGNVAPPSLLGFYLDPKVNHNGVEYTMNGQPIGSDDELKILVATQASQVIPTGIGEETTRMNAMDALKETYDKVEIDEKNGTEKVIIRHPWYLEENTK